MIDINKNNFKLVRKVVLPFIEKFKDTGLFSEKELVSFKKSLNNNDSGAILPVYPFTITPYLMKCGTEGVPLNFHEYYGDKESLKVALIRLFFPTLASQCDIQQRDLFVSYLSIMASKLNLDVRLNSGVIELEVDVNVFLMIDYERSLTGKRLGYYYNLVVGKGISLYDMEIDKIYKVKGDLEMKGAISDIINSIK